jgi:serine protease Do
MVKKYITSIFVVCLGAFALAGSALASISGKEGFADLVKSLLPAVVNVQTTQKVTNSRALQLFPHGSPFEEFQQFFDRFGMTPPPEMRGDNDAQADEEERPLSAGSGFIIDPTGYLVTNYHVVKNAEKITIKFSDNSELEAGLIGHDGRTDLALLKVKPKKDLPYVKFGNSEIVRVGDVIIAIGNPFGFGGTVTSGIVSSQARDIRLSESIVDNFIQTDAAINKGNSGGPMFNMNGEVIGINTALFSPSGVNIGIGFAVPSSLAKPIIQQLRKAGKVKRAWLGVTIGTTDGIAESLGIPKGKGALVINVAKDSPAEKSGLTPGDIILKFDNKEITNTRQLPRIVAETKVNTKVRLDLMSKGKHKTVDLVLDELDEKKEGLAYGNISSKKTTQSSIRGMRLEPINSTVRSKYAIPKDISGLVVVEVNKKSSAYRRGVRAGDVIVSINQKQITKTEELESALKSAKRTGRKSIMLMLSRKGSNIFLQLPVGKV